MSSWLSGRQSKFLAEWGYKHIITHPQAQSDAGFQITVMAVFVLGMMAVFILGMNTALCQEIELFQRVTGWELPRATSASTPLDCEKRLAFNHGGKGQGEMENRLCQCSAARNFSPV